MSVTTSEDRERQFAKRGARPDFVPGVVICRVAEDSVANVPAIGARARVRGAAVIGAGVMGGAAALDAPAVMPEAINRPVQYLIRNRQIKDIEPIFARRPNRGAPQTMRSLDLPAGPAAAQIFATSVRDSESEHLRGICLIRIANTSDPEKVAKQLEESDGIEYAHAVPARWLAVVRARAAAAGADPLINRQWGLRAVRWFDAKVPDAKQVKLAVLDTGIDTSHPDLAGAISTYEHDGATDEDIIGHGTHVAGIIAARAQNDLGIAGLSAPELHIWKIFGDQPAADGEYYVDETMYLRALNAVRTSGIQVVNLSIGGTQLDRTEALLFGLLRDAGIAVVAAMGNEYEDGNPTEYPAAHVGTIAVGATNEANRRAYFSCTGAHIALSAPGMNILSTLPLKTSATRDQNDTEYNAWSGTSMASPHVAAAAALVLAKHPGWDAKQVRDRLMKTALHLPSMGKSKFTSTLGAGLLDLKTALS